MFRGAVLSLLMALILPLALLFVVPAPAVAQSLPRPAILGLSHVTLRSADLAKSREFYGRVLGLAVEGTPAATALRFRVNHRQYIELVAAGSNAPADRLVEVGFETKDAEALRRYLAAHGVQVPKTVTPAGGGSRSFKVRDPEGHQISFVQYAAAPHNHKATGRPISTRMIHAGFIVRDRAAEDHFYHDILGFRVYWHGGMKNGETDWVDMQVPNGTDWLEYMLNVEAHPSAREAGVMRHLALGVEEIRPAVRQAEQSGWPMPEKAEIGRDGKWQLNLYDPDLTRVEIMGFRPVATPCCAAYTGPHPGRW